MRTPPLISALAVAALAGAAASVSAGIGPPRVVFSTFDPATSSIAVAPGQTRQFESFNGLFRSAGGTRFILAANLTGDDATDRLILAGDIAENVSPVVIAQQGDAIAGTMRTLNIVDNPRITDSGAFAFSSNSLGTGTPSIFFFTGTVEPTPSYSIAAAIGQPIPFLAGSTYTSGFSSTLLDSTGRAGFQAGINTGGVVTPAVFFNNQVVARAADAATAPTLLAGTMTDTWGTFTLRRVFVDSAGDTFFWWGTTTGGLDVAALDNIAVAQEGSPLPGTAGPVVGAINSVWQEPSGSWYVRGSFDDGATAADDTDFVLRSGVVIARRGDPIFPGSQFVWDRVAAGSTQNGFLWNVGTRGDDYAVAGNVRNTETGERTAAVVVNGESAYVFRGRAIDVDGDGSVSDDNAVIAGFKSETGPGTAILTRTALWMVVDVNDSAGADRGEAIVRVNLQLGGCAANFNGVGGVSVQDVYDFLTDWSSQVSGGPIIITTADFNESGAVTVQDIYDFLAAWIDGC